MCFLIKIISISDINEAIQERSYKRTKCINKADSMHNNTYTCIKFSLVGKMYADKNSDSSRLLRCYISLPTECVVLLVYNGTLISLIPQGSSIY